jgi:hypothetical protein
VVFHDSTLREIAELKPQSLTALGRVSGVGSAKLERYGEAFVDVVRSFADEAVGRTHLRGGPNPPGGLARHQGGRRAR